MKTHKMKQKIKIFLVRNQIKGTFHQLQNNLNSLKWSQHKPKWSQNKPKWSPHRPKQPLTFLRVKYKLKGWTNKHKTLHILIFLNKWRKLANWVVFSKSKVKERILQKVFWIGKNWNKRFPTSNTEFLLLKLKTTKVIFINSKGEYKMWKYGITMIGESKIKKLSGHL